MEMLRLEYPRLGNGLEQEQRQAGVKLHLNLKRIQHDCEPIHISQEVNISQK